MRLINIAVLLIITFLASALTEVYLSNLNQVLLVEGADQPASSGLINFIKASSERISPHDWISQNEIHVYNDKVVIDVTNPQWAYFTNTNSMDPVIDETSHAIEIVPESPEDIHLGDIISYKDGDDAVIHRVIGISSDEQGTYYIMKGDNNPIKDLKRVRFNDIQRIVVAIIY